MEKKLLIIDDSADVVGVILDAFEDLFDTIDAAYDIDTACKFLDAATFSLVILDINLNNRNGAEIIKFVNTTTDSANKDTPFVIVSGFITSSFVDHYRNRFAGVMLKPFDILELRQMAEKILGKYHNPDEENSSQEIFLEEPLSEEIRAEETSVLQAMAAFPVSGMKERVDQIMIQLKKNIKQKQIFKQMKVDRNPDNYVTTRIGMLISLSTAICVKMDWNSDKTIEKFVYAAYLHDMALSHRPDLVRVNTSKKLAVLPEKERRIVFDHPTIAANTIAVMPEIPTEVEMIIRQHHELPNETGFPTKCGNQKISPLAAVFIVADNLTEYILENPKWKMEEFMANAKTQLHGSQFIKVIRSLSDINKV